MIKFLRDKVMGHPEKYSDGSIRSSTDENFGFAMLFSAIAWFGVASTIIGVFTDRGHGWYGVGIVASIIAIGYLASAFIACPESYDRKWAIGIGITAPGFMIVMSAIGLYKSMVGAGKFLYKFHENIHNLPNRIAMFRARRQAKKNLIEDKKQRIRIAKEMPNSPFRMPVSSCGECGRPTEESWGEYECDEEKPKIMRGTIGRGPG